MAKAALTKGNRVLGGEGYEPDKKDASNNKYGEKVAAITAQGAKDVDMIVVNTIKAAKARILAPSIAASIVTGRIRVKFVDAVRKNTDNSQFGYEIQSFKYLDDILFNDLQYIVQSIINFGSRSSLTLNQIMKMIVDTSNVIEYYIPEEDYNDIKNILGVLYNEF